MNTIEAIVTIESVTCGKCGIVFGLEQGFLQSRQRDHKTWWCPNGHGRAYLQETAEEKAKAEAKRARENAEWYRQAWEESRAEAKRTENSLRTTKGHLTRVKNRIEAGVCIHCNRTFQALAKHMQSKHGGAS